jgi:hypothetical protein
MLANPQQDVQGTDEAMQIGVEYYLEHDLKKASYFQKKMNKLAVETLDAKTNENCQPAKYRFRRQMQAET